jgi:hypothetical protein
MDKKKPISVVRPGEEGSVPAKLLSRNFGIDANCPETLVMMKLMCTFTYRICGEQMFPDFLVLVIRPFFHILLVSHIDVCSVLWILNS